MQNEIAPGDKIAFLGVGSMGVHMANAIARVGYRVVGWSRRAKDFDVGIDFEFDTDLKAAVDGARAIIVCVRDQVAVTDVLFGSGLFEELSPGTAVIDMGTSGPKTAASHSKLLGERGVSYLDAPVSGGTGGAKNASLSIFVGGSDDDFKRVKGVLSAMGRPHLLGPVGSGQAAKLANQIIVGITIAAVAEGLAFAERSGIDALRLLDALHGGFASSKVLEVHGPRMAGRDYTAAGAARLHLKDLALAADEGGLNGLPHAQQVKAGFESLVSNNGAALDHSAYASLYQSERT